MSTKSGELHLIQSAVYPMRLNTFVGQTVSGTVSGTLRVNGAIVTGWANQVWNTTASSSTATANNTLAAGDNLTMTISGQSNYLGFGFTYGAERL